MNTNAPSVVLAPVVAEPEKLAPWVADCGDGTYRNPVIYADYSDPDVVRVGDDFYLVASSFNCTPALPILHSRDLVNWTLIGHALKNLPDARYDQVQPGEGVWAPSIRFHAGKYWIFYPTPDEGIFLVTAENPAGPWSAPHCVQAGRGLIDPCPLWDDDGRAYLVHAYAGSRAGVKHRLRVCPMAPDGSKLLGEGQIVYHEPQKHPTLEGPKFLKHDGWYYILAPAGGVETGWQVAFRSKNIYGPYEDKIVLHQGATAINGPHQGALVDTADDGWWFVHFQDAGVYGRIVHLQPVHWVDGWPLMGKVNGDGCGEPVLRHQKPPTLSRAPVAMPQTSDEFDAPRLGYQWQWNANHRDAWFSLSARTGWLRLFPQSSAGDRLELQPNLLLQKFPARSFSAETSLAGALQAGEEAGLVIAGKASAALALEKTIAGQQLVLRIDGQVRFSRELASQIVKLRVTVKGGGLCRFSYATGASWTEIPVEFQAKKGVWIGARVGLCAVARGTTAPAGHADFDWFRID